MMKFIFTALLVLLFVPCVLAERICVMPVLTENSEQVRHAVEAWLQQRGVATVDCIANPAAKSDFVLGFFVNQSTVITPRYYVYSPSPNSFYITQQAYPPYGLTIWLQSLNRGSYVGNIWVGAMLFYGRCGSLQAGLKKIVKVLRREERDGKRLSRNR